MPCRKGFGVVRCHCRVHEVEESFTGGAHDSAVQLCVRLLLNG
jgi:hypothetical protein